MKMCCDCNIGKMYEYRDVGTSIIQSICWNCGRYESNSEAFELFPNTFVNLVRENPAYFMKKYGTYQPTGNTKNTSTDSETEPTNNNLIKY